MTVGPVELARHIGMQREIAEIVQTVGSDTVTLEDAQRIAGLQRENVRLILPSITDEEASSLNGEEVVLAIGFFNVWRTNNAVRDAQDQIDRSEAASETIRKATEIGERTFPRSRGSMAAARPNG